VLLDMSPLARRALAELVGTALLVAAVIGSGIAAQRLSPTDVGLQLFENTAATAGALVAIILALGAVSGAHVNPIVTLVDRVLGGLDNRQAAAYVGSQIAGGAIGAVIANLMFGDAAVTFSTHHRATGAHLLGEVVATFGLVLVVFGVARSGRAATAPFAVAAYIASAYWFTSSTSFANPAVTVARALSNTFAGIAPSSVPGFLGAQVLGGVIGCACVIALYPNLSEPCGTDVRQTATPLRSDGRGEELGDVLEHEPRDRADDGHAHEVRRPARPAAPEPRRADRDDQQRLEPQHE
jgi:arsenate reductase